MPRYKWTDANNSRLYFYFSFSDDLESVYMTRPNQQDGASGTRVDYLPYMGLHWRIDFNGEHYEFRFKDPNADNMPTVTLMDSRRRLKHIRTLELLA